MSAGCVESVNEGSTIAAVNTSGVQASDVSAGTDRLIYTAGKTGIAAFLNQSDRPVYLPGCAPFGFEQSLDGLWIFIGPPFVCFWEGFAVAVGPNESVPERSWSGPVEA